MNQAEALHGIAVRKSFQPAQPFFADACNGRLNRFLHHGKDWGNLRICGGIFTETFGSPEHLIHIASHPRPTEGANLINNFGWVSATGSQIAAMENQVRRNLPQIAENCCECTSITVNIRYDCDPHRNFRPINSQTSPVKMG